MHSVRNQNKKNEMIQLNIENHIYKKKTQKKLLYLQERKEYYFQINNK